MNAEFWPGVRLCLAWGTAAAWCVRTTGAIQGLPLIEDLNQAEWDVTPEAMPRLTVVVPARNEEEKIAATLDALMQADYANLQVIAVDDRSTDATGTVMDRYAERFAPRLRVLHVTELREGWLGKTNAMRLAVEASEADRVGEDAAKTAEVAEKSAEDYVLFTDADILFSPSVLRRAVAYAEREHADHLVVMPTLLVQSWGEGAFLGVFHLLAMWAHRLWKVRDPESQRDFIGVGAFNLVRRGALEAIRGLEPQRMVVVEDITLGARMKAARMRQRVAFARGQVQVHWASGARGVIRVVTKNLFAVFSFQTGIALAACAGVAVLFLSPFAMLTTLGTVAPGLLILLCVAAAFRGFDRMSGIAPKYAWAYPVGTVMFCYAIVRSVAVTWKDGGVRWRGTLYPLRELRKHSDLRQWQKGSHPKRANSAR